MRGVQHTNYLGTDKSWKTWVKRFWSYVEIGKDNECWKWLGYLDKDGYGQFSHHRYRKAHRFSMRLYLKRKLKRSELVLHDCDNPPCVNPKHLFLGTPLINAHDRDSKGRTSKLKGEQNGNAKLDNGSVTEIRRLLQEGCFSQKIISDLFDVTPATITLIKQGKLWSHIK